jgi:Sporulation inhibitor A
MIKKISDKDLIESYKAALKVDRMAKDFVDLLRKELMNRSLFTKFG